jgi:hypothetical protein
MSTANNSRITLVFEAGADPIRGSVEHPDGSREPFWGWLELSEKLRRVAFDEPERPSDQDPPHPTRQEES